jgi:hypothetical protein
MGGGLTQGDDPELELNCGYLRVFNRSVTKKSQVNNQWALINHFFFIVPGPG